MALGSLHPAGEHPAVSLRGAKSIWRPTVPAFLVSRRNRTPTDGARARSDPDSGMKKLAVGPTVPSKNSPLWRLPNATDALSRASRDWIWLPGTRRKRPYTVAPALLPRLKPTPTRTPGP